MQKKNENEKKQGYWKWSVPFTNAKEKHKTKMEFQYQYPVPLKETRIPHHRYLRFVNDNSTPQNITLRKLFCVTIFSPAQIMQIASDLGGTPYNGLYGEAPSERGTFFGLQVMQEPITRSEQLPYQAQVTTFLRTSLFLDTSQGTFSRENRISTMAMSAFEV